MFLPHLKLLQVFEDGTWGYVKGQLQTIDRPYGFGIDQLMHHITDGHVAHHLFFTGIPHYNLMKATKALQEKLQPFGVYRKEVCWILKHGFDMKLLEKKTTELKRNVAGWGSEASEFVK